jgi:hypothetical protein
VLVSASVILDALTVVYLFVNRLVGGMLYVSAILLGAATIWLLGPRVFWEFVTDEMRADSVIWMIRLSFLFVLAAPFIKARLTRRLPGAYRSWRKSTTSGSCLSPAKEHDDGKRSN